MSTVMGWGAVFLSLVVAVGCANESTCDPDQELRMGICQLRLADTGPPLSDAGRDLITRTLTRDESSLRIVFTMAVILSLSGGISGLGGWPAYEVAHMAWFGLSACCFVVAHFFMVEAFRHAEVVVVAPFRYFIIIWATLAGYLFWGEVPDAAVFVGVAVIVAAGLYIGWREARVGRQQKTAVGH